MNNTKIKCCLTGCKYNSSCCACPCHENTYCTLKEIEIGMEDETGLMTCKNYEYDYTKKYECEECQIEKHGEIIIMPDVEYVEVDDLDDLF